MNAPSRRLATGVALLLGARGAVATDLTLEVSDPDGKPVADAVVYAAPVTGTAPPVRPKLRAIIDQVHKEFVPRVSIVQTGTEIFFPNSDNIRHSIYSFSPAKTFATKLYSGREAAPVLFDTTGLVILGCNIHDTMVAWVFVVDTPWFGKTDADGASTIKGIPPGEYRISAAAPAPSGNLKSIEMTLRVGGDGPQRQSVSLLAGG
ncbi:MAG: methylamine utilization protein [Pseudomonadota bacterium]